MQNGSGAMPQITLKAYHEAINEKVQLWKDLRPSQIILAVYGSSCSKIQEVSFLQSSAGDAGTSAFEFWAM